MSYMDEEELLYLLALQKVPKVGDIMGKKLLQHFGSAKAVVQAPIHQLSKVEGIGTIMLKHLKEKDYLKEAEDELRFVQNNNISIIPYTHQDYPTKLSHCIDGPLLLFTSGTLQLNAPRMLSIVGTRNITSYGTKVCEMLIEQFSSLGITVVSGYAYGVDICAHKAAIKYNLPTIACLAHGLNQIYPKKHEAYKAAMEKNGGFVSDFWSTSIFDRNNFLRRNRIIAGLSEATIVIESAEKGGSLVTADIAHSYNRDVFAVPGKINDAYSIGCNQLIKTQKAQMITSAADVVYALGWDMDSQPEKAIQKQLFVALTDDEQVIVAFLKTVDKEHIDVIALHCQMPIFKISSILLQLEMKGVIRPLPGKLFSLA